MGCVLCCGEVQAAGADAKGRGRDGSEIVNSVGCAPGNVAVGPHKYRAAWLDAIESAPVR